MVNETLGKHSNLVTLPYYPRYGAEPPPELQDHADVANENPVTWSCWSLIRVLLPLHDIDEY